jgi:hypothetical protein
MLATSKGQGLIIDFSLGFFVFIIIFITITNAFNSKIEDINKKNDLEAMRIKAGNSMNLLIRSPGEPSNWENLPISSVKYIGLASNDRNILETKLSAFSNLGENYFEGKRKIGLAEYDFFFEFQGVDDVNAGLEPFGDIDKVVETRVVSYKGESAIARLVVYKSG